MTVIKPSLFIAIPKDEVCLLILATCAIATVYSHFTLVFIVTGGYYSLENITHNAC